MVGGGARKKCVGCCRPVTTGAFSVRPCCRRPTPHHLKAVASVLPLGLGPHPHLLAVCAQRGHSAPPDKWAARPSRNPPPANPRSRQAAATSVDRRQLFLYSIERSHVR